MNIEGNVNLHCTTTVNRNIMCTVYLMQKAMTGWGHCGRSRDTVPFLGLLHVSGSSTAANIDRWHIDSSHKQALPVSRVMVAPWTCLRERTIELLIGHEEGGGGRKRFFLLGSCQLNRESRETLNFEKINCPRPPPPDRVESPLSAG